MFSNKLKIISVLIPILSGIWFVYTESPAIRKLLKLPKHYYALLKKKWFTRKRRKYNKELMSREFMSWQKEVLFGIYRPLIASLREEGVDIDITHIVIEGKDEDSNSITVKEEYECVTIPVKSVPYPFKGVCDKLKLKTRSEEDVLKSTWKYEENRVGDLRKYRNLIYYTIKFPKRLGYMLDEIEIENGNLRGISAYPGIYEHNLLESHILEYELYRVYQENKLSQRSKADEALMDKLPIRREIHNKFIMADEKNKETKEESKKTKEERKESNILKSGKYRNSLLGVQALVLVKSRVGTYDVLRIRRSEQVASKAGFLQFIPSGGFEAYNDDLSFDAQWENYSITKVLFRELLEECFGMDEDAERSKNQSPESIYFDENIRKILEQLLKQGNAAEESPKIIFEFIGFATNLVNLRTELCFLIRIDDPDFSGRMQSNEETSQTIRWIRMDEVERLDFWKREDGNDLELLNCSSAALWELARKNSHYREALKMTREIAAKVH